MSRIPTSLRSALYAEKPEPRCAYCQSPERLLGIPLETDHIILRFARSGAAKPHWKTYACEFTNAFGLWLSFLQWLQRNEDQCA